MNKILSQDEVDALLTGVSDGEVSTEPDTASEVGQVLPYDFSDRSIYLQTRPLNLATVNDRLAKLLGTSLATALRRQVHTRAQEVELKKFTDFIHSLPTATSLHLFKMEPLPGLGILVLDGPLVFNLLETFFGAAGPGQTKMEGREFTTIENKLINKVATLVLSDQEKAWESVHPLRFTLEHIETTPQFTELLNPDEVIISIKFEVELDDPIGLITFCIPYSTLEPIREHLDTPYHRKDQKIESKWTKTIKKHLQQATVEMAVELGRTWLPARELLGLKPGDVLILDKDYTESLVVKVECVPKFSGFAGLWKGKKAFKVNQFFEENL